MNTDFSHVIATIQWREGFGCGTEPVLIKLSLDYVPEEDDYVFFYCNGIEELKNLMKEDNGEDFVVLDYTPMTLFFL